MAFAAGNAHAEESGFLKPLAGKWNGSGIVKIRVSSTPIKVSCVSSAFASLATTSTLSLYGKCTGLIIFSRSIGVDLKAKGAKYSGSYVGAGTGTASLTGGRGENSLNLVIHWAKDVNGHRTANMEIDKLSRNAMRLTTIDTNPKTGKKVVTGRIDLKRAQGQ